MYRPSESIFVVAEIGGNFTTFEEGLRLIDAATKAGADAVKLQTYQADTIVTRNCMFEMENTGRISQYDYFAKYQTSIDIQRAIFEYSRSHDILCFSTPSHETDVDFLLKMEVKLMKIGADDANNIPLIRYIARTGLPVILSTGMCTIDEVDKAVDAIIAENNDKIVILHTVSGYPTRPEHVNLEVLRTYKKRFPQYTIGYSDHTLSPTACVAAAALGADVLERHFTLNKSADGPDHRISSTPEEFRLIADMSREISDMRGSGEKNPVGPEILNRRNNRKSVVAISDIRRGDIFSVLNIGIRRPGYGLEPRFIDEFIGRRSTREIKKDELLHTKDII